MSVLLNNGNGTFAATVDYATGRPLSVAAADLNGDGKPDLAVANADSNNVSVLLNASISDNTTTTLTSSLNPSHNAQSVTFTANVSVAAPASGTPTGTVTFCEILGSGAPPDRCRVRCRCCVRRARPAPLRPIHGRLLRSRLEHTTSLPLSLAMAILLAGPSNTVTQLVNSNKVFLPLRHSRLTMTLGERYYLQSLSDLTMLLTKSTAT